MAVTAAGEGGHRRTRVYCYVVERGTRVAGFPADLDDSDPSGTKTALRVRLVDVMEAHGRTTDEHGHLFRLEVREFISDKHLYDLGPVA